MALVVGATGMLGREICWRLVTAGEPVTALVRPASDPQKVRALEALGAHIVVGDLRDPDSLEAACRNVSAVVTTVSAMPFSYQPGVNDVQTVDRDGMLTLIDVAEETGVEQFVYTSFSGNLDVACPLHDAKRAVEARLHDSSLVHTILRPSCFMEAWLGPVAGFDAANAKATIYGTGREPISWIAIGDVAEFAVRSLSAEAARNASLELGGPRAIAPLDVVRIFEAAVGRPFELQYVPLEMLEQQQAAATDEMANSFVALMRGVAGGDAIDMTKLLEAIPVKLTSVEEYAAQFAPHAAGVS